MIFVRCRPSYRHHSIVHRTLLIARQILHRDISGNNILVQPVHNARTEGAGSELASDAPRFIAEVLDGIERPQKCVKSEMISILELTRPGRLRIRSVQDRAASLLIDFDSSVDLEVINQDQANHTLTKRTVRVRSCRPE